MAEETTQAPETGKAKGKTSRSIENITLPIKDILVPEQWNREGPGKLDALISSLKTHGQIVALTVRPGDKPGTFMLVDGMRRIMAMKEAGIKEAKVTIVETADSSDAYAKSFVANFHRMPHDPVEISNIFSVFSETMKNKKIAELFDVSEGFVSQHLAIRKLPSKFLTALKKETLLMAEARELCRLNPEEDAEFLEKIGTALMESTLDTFGAADKITSYLDKKDEKDSGKPKGKKPKGKSESTKRGRPTNVKDYSEVKDKITVCNKTRLLTLFDKYNTKLEGTKSTANRRYFKGWMDCLETVGGLREDD